MAACVVRLDFPDGSVALCEEDDTMRFAIDFPLEVRGLVLVATSSRVGRAAADWYRQRVEMVEHSDPQLRETLDRDTADVYAESPAELEEGLLIRRQSTADPRGYGNACAAMAATKRTSALESSRMPSKLAIKGTFSSAARTCD